MNHTTDSDIYAITVELTEDITHTNNCGNSVIDELERHANEDIEPGICAGVRDEIARHNKIGGTNYNLSRWKRCSIS
jgi:hypothetical protein